VSDAREDLRGSRAQGSRIACKRSARTGIWVRRAATSGHRRGLPGALIPRFSDKIASCRSRFEAGLNKIDGCKESDAR
jgi:hypothetical protein